ncbi:hypothetical protein BGZ95_007056, partial [Linnemannia exigua]
IPSRCNSTNKDDGNNKEQQHINELRQQQEAALKSIPIVFYTVYHQYAVVNFHDYGYYSHQCFASSSNSPNATGNISSSGSTPQSRPTGFGQAGTFDPHRNIQDQTVAKPIWSVEYYSKFFDVDTAQVRERCFASVIPKENFLDVMQGSPDLY